jgi:hypothetical protein
MGSAYVENFCGSPFDANSICVVVLQQENITLT